MLILKLRIKMAEQILAESPIEAYIWVVKLIAALLRYWIIWNDHWYD